MNDSATCKIRPAGRLLLSIGRDLIRNVHSAVMELVRCRCITRPHRDQRESKEKMRENRCDGRWARDDHGYGCQQMDGSGNG